MKKILFSISFVAAALTLWVQPSLAVSPNPLENAYWRFEEGPNGADVTPGSDVVLDSINSNNMRADSSASAPNYTTTVAPFPLRSSASNHLALAFSTHSGGGDDLFTNDQNIDNGIVASGGGFTVEAAFQPGTVSFPNGPFQAIVAKDGLPAGTLPTFTLKVRGDDGTLQVEQYDGAGTLKNVKSTAPLAAGTWYAAAAVNDGTTLSLYLRSGSDSDYVFEGSTPVSGDLYQGTADDWDHAWSIGRSVFGGGGDGTPADWFGGIIDEVRLSNRAVAPSEFLFAPVPEPSCVALLACAFVGLAIGGRRRCKRS